MNTNTPNKIIVAPLNWGWGHATRCIPIIKEIQELGLEPVIASDGDALVFLRKEFPALETIVLPSYGIVYRKFFVLSMLMSLPKIIIGVIHEQRVIKNYVEKYFNEVLGIVSDNRLGVYNKEIKSVYITHQLNVKAGVFSGLVNKIHAYFIKKHQECWVPDEAGSKYSGALSKNTKIQAKYIGVLSRFRKQELLYKYDLLVLLSGIEGQRKVLENIMSKELKNFKGNVLLVRGSLKGTTHVFPSNIEVVDYLLSDELERKVNESKVVLSRSGYTTVMDMIKLQKKVFYIPTPGQTEQEYLANFLKKNKMANSCSQKDFEIKMLVDISFYESREPLPQENMLSSELQRVFKPFQG